MRTRTTMCVLLATLTAASLDAQQRRGSQVDAGDRDGVGVGVHVTGWAPGFTLSKRLGDVVDLGVDLSLLVSDDDLETPDGTEASTRLESLLVGPYLRLYLGTRESVAPTLELHAGYLRSEATSQSGGGEGFESVEDGLAAGTTLGLTWFASSRFDARGGLLFRYRSTTASSEVPGVPDRDRTRWDLFQPAFSVTFRF